MDNKTSRSDVPFHSMMKQQDNVISLFADIHGTGEEQGSSSKTVDAQAILETLMHHLPTGLVMYGRDLRMIACNAKYREMLDLPGELFAGGPPTLNSVIRFNCNRGDYGPGDPETQYREAMDRLAWPDENVYERHRQNGTILEVRRMPLPGGGFVATVEDVTELRATERALRQSEARFRGAFETAAIGMAIVDLDGNWLRVNRALCQLVGYAEDELLRTNFQAITHPGDLEKDLHRVKDLLLGKIEFYHMEKRYFHKNGGIVWILLSVSLVRDENGKPVHFVSQIEDISDRKRHEEDAFFLAHHDSLTGLANRRLMRDRLIQAMARAHRFRHLIGLLFVDLDHFKQINDSYGHQTGDSVLKAVATRLSSCVRGVDTVSRLGGDEFVVILAEISRVEDACMVAEKIRQALAAPIDVDGTTLTISASIGITTYSGEAGRDEDTLLHQADFAMYEAKQAGRNECRLFDSREPRP